MKMRPNTSTAVTTNFWYYPLDPCEADELDSVSEGSTVAVKGILYSNCGTHRLQPQTKKTHLKVQFDHAVAEITGHSNSVGAGSGWYTNQDIMRFRQDVQNHVAVLAASRPEENVAAHAWLDAVYLAYRESAHKNAPERHQSNSAPFPAHCCDYLGLEQWFPRSVQRDRLSRYAALRRVVIGHHSLDTHHRLEQRSRQMSHPARLFAQHMAHIAAAKEEGDDRDEL